MLIWPGTSDPYKRKKTIKFLIITAIIGVSAAAASSAFQYVVNPNDPLKACIDDKDTPYKIRATLELIVDGKKADIPATLESMTAVKEACTRWQGMERSMQNGKRSIRMR